MRTLSTLILGDAGVAALAQPPAPSTTPGRWSEQQANDWYKAQPWLVGANYVPGQRHQRARDVAGRHVRPAADRHRARLGGGHRHEHDARVPARPALAAGRRRASRSGSIEFLRDRRQAPHQDRCSCCSTRCGIRIRSSASSATPKPGVHNSGWLQSPGAKALQDPKRAPAPRGLRQGRRGRSWRTIARVLAWDVWNEPDNMNGSSYGSAGAGRTRWSSC